MGIDSCIYNCIVSVMARYMHAKEIAAYDEESATP
jgi:hypothetical protein